MGVLDGIVYQVCYRAFQAQRPAEVHQVHRPLEVHSNLLVAVVVDQGLQELGQVEGGGGLQTGFIAKEVQRGIDHALHFIDITKQLLLLLGIFDELAAQAHTCQRRTQIMGNSRKHLRAFGNEVLDLRLHGVERGDRLAQFMGAFESDRWRTQVAAKTPCSTGETLQWACQLTGADPGHQ
ncbi:hypothetical protein D3C77_507780 [compost metagenome]